MIGWDIGYPSTPLKNYFDQIQDKRVKILIPGAGNSYEAEYLYHQGFTQVHILDISSLPLANFRHRNPDFPSNQIIQGDFFLHKGTYDLIIEQTFFCSFPPTKELRNAYAIQMSKLIRKGGKLVGVWFNTPLTGDMEKRPFGGNRKEYLSYLSPYFNIKTFDECYNSILPRKGKELFGIFEANFAL